MNTEIVNKKALSNKANKRLRTFDGITTSPKGMNRFKACESEMIIALNNKFKNIYESLDKDEQIEIENHCIPFYYPNKYLSKRNHIERNANISGNIPLSFWWEDLQQF